MHTGWESVRLWCLLFEFSDLAGVSNSTCIVGFSKTNLLSRGYPPIPHSKEVAEGDGEFGVGSNPKPYGRAGIMLRDIMTHLANCLPGSFDGGALFGAR